MTSTTTISPAVGRLEKVKNGAAVLGAVAGAIVGLYGVYEKVRTDARADTTASYNTLAPQVNQMGEALKQLQIENQQLREIVAHGQDKPRMAAKPAKSVSRPANTGASGDDAVKPAPAANVSPPAAIDQGSPAATPAGIPATAPEAPAGTEEDRISGLLRTVGRTREAIESLRKVPEDFGRVVGKP